MIVTSHSFTSSTFILGAEDPRLRLYTQLPEGSAEPFIDRSSNFGPGREVEVRFESPSGVCYPPGA